MKVQEKVSFAKFFPTSQQFVVIRGEAKSPTDFNMSIDIGDGNDKASFYFDPYGYKDNLNMMKAMRDAMQQALEFYEKTLRLPAMKGTHGGSSLSDLLSLWEDKKAAKTEAPAKKPAAKKKAAAKK